MSEYSQAMADAVKGEVQPIIDEVVAKSEGGEQWVRDLIARSIGEINGQIEEIATTEDAERRDEIAGQVRASAASLVGWVTPVSPDASKVHEAHARFAMSMGLSESEADEFATLLEAQ